MLVCTKYMIMMFRSSGVYVVLFWSASCLFSYNQLLTAHLPQLHILNPLGVSVIINAVISIYPILGWLADVHYGRYRVIIWSLRIMWD